MTAEFVVSDDGREVDWIDPVESVAESATAWLVDNGHHIYEIPKRPGRTVSTRNKETA